LTDGDVVEMSRYLAEAFDAISGWFPGGEWPVGYQSEAARERAEVIHGAGGSWGDMPVRTSYAAAGFSWKRSSSASGY
jgi:hypothetical protein